jgi:hypothetical protein
MNSGADSAIQDSADARPRLNDGAKIHAARPLLMTATSLGLLWLIGFAVAVVLDHP